MITIKSTAPNVLTIETPTGDKTARITQGNQSTVITSSGVLIRILNDTGGFATFSAIHLGNATISVNDSEITLPAIPDFLYISNFGTVITA